MRALTTTLAIALTLGVAAPAAALTTKQACAMTADIADLTATKRKDGVRRKKAERQIVAGLTEEAQPLKAAVYGIVDWIYGLPKEQLDEDIKSAWNDQCMAAN